MKYFFVILISILMFSCSNKVNYQLNPATPHDEAIQYAAIIKAYLMDDSKIEEIGVNYLKYFGDAIFVLHQYNLIDQEISDRAINILNRVYNEDMTGFYSMPQDIQYDHTEDSDRLATRDDYLGALRTVYVLCRKYSDIRACEHLRFMTDKMNDAQDPYIPEELRKENEASRLLFGIFDGFVEKLINFYKNNFIAGLKLKKDVWSPYHRNCFRRASEDYSGNQKFWDMSNYYFSVNGSVGDVNDISSKLLEMNCLSIARENNPTYWTNKLDNYIHDNFNMNTIIEKYFLSNPNQFFQVLGKLMLGNARIL